MFGAELAAFPAVHAFPRQQWGEPVRWAAVGRDAPVALPARAAALVRSRAHHSAAAVFQARLRRQVVLSLRGSALVKREREHVRLLARRAAPVPRVRHATSLSCSPAPRGSVGVVSQRAGRQRRSCALPAPHCYPQVSDPITEGLSVVQPVRATKRRVLLGVLPWTRSRCYVSAGFLCYPGDPWHWPMSVPPRCAPLRASR